MTLRFAKKALRWASVLFGLSLAIVLASCSTNDAAPSPGSARSSTGTGTVGLRLQIGGGAAINTVTYALTGPSFTQTGTIDVTYSNTVSALIGGLPPGPGYTVSLAASTDGGFQCAGESTTFSIQARAITTVVVVVTCEFPPTNNGSILINGTASVCPRINAVSIVPDNASVGSSVALSSSASVPSNLPLTYAWTATSGTVVPPNGQNPTYTCTAEGTPTITLTVSDGENTTGCPDTVSAEINCTACANEGSTCNIGNVCWLTSTCQSANCVGVTPAPAGTSCTGGGACDGQGNCLQCLGPSTCPGTDTACATRTCTAGVCGDKFAASGTVAASMPGTCKRLECDGNGNIITVVDNTNVPASTACSTGSCNNGTPVTTPAAPETMCGSAGSPMVCNDAGACVGCVVPADCPGTDSTCSQRTCTANVCGTSLAPYGTVCGTDEVCSGSGSCAPITVSVARIGDGVAPQSANSAAVFIETHLLNGTLAQTQTPIATVNMPTATTGTNNPLTTTGLAITEGALSLSANGKYLVMAGYAAAPGIAVATSLTVPRVVGRIDAAGNVDTSTTIAGAFVAGNVRTAASVDGSAFWVGGIGATGDGGISTGGIWFVPFGTTGGTELVPNAIRVVGTAGGQLYATGDNSGEAIFDVGSGLPTSGAPVISALSGTALASMADGGVTVNSPWAFVFFDLIPAVPGLDTLYIANDQAVTGSQPLPNGIQKWQSNGATWSFVTSVSSGVPVVGTGGAPVGFRGLTGIVTATTPPTVTLVASTVDTGSTSNRLVSIVDNGTMQTATVIATAPAKELYRGVALTPHM